MGKAKDLWNDKNEQDPKNWRTVKCNHCGRTYKINLVTKHNINEFNYCPECYNKIILDIKD